MDNPNHHHDNRIQRNSATERISLQIATPCRLCSYQYPQGSILEMDEIPPPEYYSEPPPPYQRKSQHRESSFVHRLSEGIINIDLSANCMLVFIIMILFLSNNSSSYPTSYIIPMIYFSISWYGRVVFKRKRAKSMLLVSGTYFARWAGDIAVLIYVILNNLTDYYNMSVFSTVITLPMLGIRGFYPDLFPCYNISEDDQDICTVFWSNSAGTIDGTYVFGLMLFLQLISGIIIAYDSFQLMQMDDISRNQGDI